MARISSSFEKLFLARKKHTSNKKVLDTFLDYIHQLLHDPLASVVLVAGLVNATLQVVVIDRMNLSKIKEIDTHGNRENPS